MEFIRWLVALPFIILIVVFSLANAQNLSVIWSPVHDPIMLPLYVLSLGFISFGFIIGCFLTWLGMQKTRKERRHYKRENKSLLKQMKNNNAQKTYLNFTPPDHKAIETL